MASTYSTNLRLELIGSGEQQGTWGATTNTNLGTLLEQAIAGYEEVTMTDANTTLSANNGATDQSRNAVLKILGTLSATRNLVCPTIEKTYIILNATTGGQSIQFKTSGGTGITIANGTKAIVYVDGSDVIKVVDDNYVSSGSSPQFTTIELGNASDTTLSRSSAGVLAVEGVTVSLNSTGATHTAGTIELGAATDTTISRSSAGVIAVEGVTVSLNSTSATHTAGTIELGAATDTTLSRSAAGVLAVEGVVVPTISSTNTLTNKRVTPRMTSTTSTTSPWAWNSDDADTFAFTALANDLTINADAGTPTDGQRVVFRFKPNTTGIDLTWTTGTSKSFRAVGITLPTALTNAKTTYVGCVYNSADSRWDAIATVTEA